MNRTVVLSVPRELLESFAAYVADSPNAVMRSRAAHLRTLLDKPEEKVEVVQADNAEQALTLLDFALSFALCNMDHGGTRRDVKKAQAHLEAYRKFKAIQHHGDPVMPGSEEFSHMSTIELRGYHAGWYAACIQNRSAEQPAPVAVVLPERELYMKYLVGVIPHNASEVNAYKDGWNTCLEEVARLNGVKPDLDTCRTMVELFPDSAGGYYNGCPLSALSDPMQCWRDGYEIAKKRAIAAGLKVKS